jgi:hypothetical protein
VILSREKPGNRNRHIDIIKNGRNELKKHDAYVKSLTKKMNMRAEEMRN